MAGSTLTSRDLRHALSLSSEWHAAASEDELAQLTVDGIQALIPCDAVGWNDIDLRSGATHILSSQPGYISDQQLADMGRLMSEHPVAVHVEETHETRPVQMADLVSAERLHSLELYNEVFRQSQIEDIVALALEVHTKLVGLALTFDRRRDRSRARELLDILRPHLVVAYLNVRQQQERRKRIAALERAHAPARSTAVRLDADGRVAERCALAEAWFGRDEPKPGRYVREDAALFVRRIDGDPPILLLDEHRLAPDPNHIRRLGLTPRQGQIVALVAEGLSNAEIARRLFVSVRTVDTHLAKAFERLGVHDRRAAVDRVLDQS